MKPADFIKEDHNIVQAVVEMHDDHEIQMAREQCYHAASNAIELHRMLKHITEREGLEGWVQEKITLANDYLSQVKDWMEHEMMNRMSGSHMNMPLEQMGEDATAGATTAGAMAGPAGQFAHRPDKSRIPASQRKKTGDKNWMIKRSDVNNPYKHLSSRETLQTRNQGQ